MPSVHVREIGYAQSSPYATSHSWWMYDPEEDTPELQWPQSIRVYDRMRRTDAQVGSVLEAVTRPVLRTPWRLDPAKARAEVVELVADDLGLPIVGQDPDPPLRTKDRFSWLEHLELATLMLPFGHMFFEQTYRPTGDGSRAHLHKLAPRMPLTIEQIDVARDGGLISITQQRIMDQAGEQRPIPVDRLVAYVYKREGANWLGRALALDTPVPTPDGWRVMGDLRPGDRVFDERGMIRHVVARQEWADRPCYEVTFGDGESLIADENHQWLTHDFRYRCQGRGEPRVVTTAEVAASVTATKSGTSNHAIPLAHPVQHVGQRLLVDPYVLGYWLGDGSKGSGRIVTADREVAGLFAARGYPCGEAPNWAVSRQWNVKGLAADLRRLGVIDYKHIPDEYLHGDVEQRFELLRGLMDSDGTITREGQCVFANTDPMLASAVLELVRSLGIRASSSVHRQTGHQSVGPRGDVITSRRDVWHVQFATHLPVFGLTRKADRLRPDNIRRRYHVIKSVRPVERRSTICIEVDSPSHLFLVGRGFVPTHNSILRQAYKNWLIKDRLLRVQAQTIERNGMGIPLYKGSPTTATQSPAAQAEMDKGIAMATSWRSGEAAGSAVPHEADLVLRGVEGDLPDALPVVKYHDEQIARAVLAHFLNLDNQSHGSYALGASFMDFFTLSLQTLAQQIADTATMHIVEDLVDVNFGPQEPAPRIVFDEIGSRQAATAQAVKLLIDAGVIQADEVLEQSTRQQYGLPPKDPDTVREAPGGFGGLGPPAEPAELGAGSVAGEQAPKAGAAGAATGGTGSGSNGQPVAAKFNKLQWVTAPKAVQARAAFNPLLHPRDTKGQFRNTWTRLASTLARWLKSDRESDPFPESVVSWDMLRRAAKGRGLSVRPLAPRKEIARAVAEQLLVDMGHKPGPRVESPRLSRPEPKKATPPKRAPAKKAAPAPAKRAAPARKTAPAKTAPARIDEAVPLARDPEGDNMIMHGDSASMNLAQALARRGRNGSANRVMELRRDVSRKDGDGRRLPVSEMLDELRRMRDRETDPALIREFNDSIERIDAPDRPVPELPPNTPPLARQLIEALNQIPYARKRRGERISAGSFQDERSLVEQVADVFGDAASGRRGDSGRSPADRIRAILRDKVHESNDGSFQIWELSERVDNGSLRDPDTLPGALRAWERGELPAPAKKATPEQKTAVPAKKVAVDPAEVAAQVSRKSSEDEMIAFLAADPRLTAATLRKVAAELDIDVPENMRAKSALQLHIAEKLAGRPRAAAPEYTPGQRLIHKNRGPVTFIRPDELSSAPDRALWVEFEDGTEGMVSPHMLSLAPPSKRAPGKKPTKAELDAAVRRVIKAYSKRDEQGRPAKRPGFELATGAFTDAEMRRLRDDEALLAKWAPDRPSIESVIDSLDRAETADAPRSADELFAEWERPKKPDVDPTEKLADLDARLVKLGRRRPADDASYRAAAQALANGESPAGVAKRLRADAKGLDNREDADTLRLLASDLTRKPKVVPAYINAEGNLDLVTLAGMHGIGEMHGVGLRRWMPAEKVPTHHAGTDLYGGTKRPGEVAREYHDANPFDRTFRYFTEAFATGHDPRDPNAHRIRRLRESAQRTRETLAQIRKGRHPMNQNPHRAAEAEWWKANAADAARDLDRLADAAEKAKIPPKPRAASLGGTTLGDVVPIDESKFATVDLKDGTLRHRGEAVPRGFSHHKFGQAMMASTHRPVRPGLEEHENAALDRYTVALVADGLNASLRKGRNVHADITVGDEKIDLNEVQNDLDAAIDAGSLTKDTVLWRGNVVKTADFNRLVPGAIYHDAGYFSTSTREADTRHILNWRGDKLPAGRKPVLFKILAPAGTKGALGHERVNEVVLPRNQEFRVVRLDQSGGTPVVVMEALTGPSTAGKVRARSIVTDFDHQGTVDRLGKPTFVGSGDQLGDRWLGAILAEQGFDGKPTVGTKADVDKVIAEGGIEVFRGVTGGRRGPMGFGGREAIDDPGTAAKYAEQFRSGDLYPGTGVFGSGTYTAHDRGTAEGYAGANGVVMRMAIRRDARIINHAELLKLRAKAGLSKAGRDLSDKEAAELAKVDPGDTKAVEEIMQRYDQLRSRQGGRNQIISDEGRLAALHGYDVIRVPAGDSRDVAGYYVVLNRTAVVVERGNAPEASRLAVEEEDFDEIEVIESAPEVFSSASGGGYAVASFSDPDGFYGPEGGQVVAISDDEQRQWADDYDNVGDAAAHLTTDAAAELADDLPDFADRAGRIAHPSDPAAYENGPALLTSTEIGGHTVTAWADGNGDLGEEGGTVIALSIVPGESPDWSDFLGSTRDSIQLDAGDVRGFAGALGTAAGVGPAERMSLNAPEAEAPRLAVGEEGAQAHAESLVRAEIVGVRRELTRQATLTPWSMRTLDSVNLASDNPADEAAYLASHNARAHAYYTSLGSHPSVYATPAASPDNPRPAIWFSPTWSGGTTGGIYRRGEASGWHAPSGTSTPIESVTAHEYGHHVTEVFFGEIGVNGTADMPGEIALRLLPTLNDQLGADRRNTIARNGDLLEPVWHGFMGDEHNPPDMTYSLSGDLLETWVHQNRDLLRKMVSGYGATSFQELLAEIWLEYSTKGEGARPHIKVIGDLMRILSEELWLPKAAPKATVDDLRKLAKERRIPIPAKARRADILKLLGLSADLE